jgi:Uncharacterized protein conserved in bacteria (DUF2252)
VVADSTAAAMSGASLLRAGFQSLMRAALAGTFDVVLAKSVDSMNILRATTSYESWMRRCTTVVEAHLRGKHQQMRDDLFHFFRGTFYRWIQIWPVVCHELRSAPRVLAVGDLHVGSFGTWRDAEGRLCWGVDDFDESYPMPYTNDLVRLAASAKVVIDAEHLTIGLREACAAILDGYRKGLRDRGCPLVLAEREVNLERFGVAAIRPPRDFWRHLQALSVPHHPMPRVVQRLLEGTLPEANLDCKVVSREAGMGSLGQQRFVAIAHWNGGLIAREAKAMVPSACLWLEGRVGHRQPFYKRAIATAVRSRDPFQTVNGTWLIRRLSPDSNPIDITDLPRERQEETLLAAMGIEAANVHLGSVRRVTSILADLGRRKPNWLRAAAKDMAKAMEREWKAFRDRGPHAG